MPKGFPLGYEIRHPKGKSREYKVNWNCTKRDNVPERREWRKKSSSTVHGFLRKIRNRASDRNASWKKQNRKIYGEFELNTYDKIKYLFDKQVERYGERCPITLRDFTTVRNNEMGRQGVKRTFTNISPDRLLDHFNYTRQNTLFTIGGWNISKGDWSLEEVKFLFKEEHFQRYMEILLERFPDRKYDWQNRGLI